MKTKTLILASCLSSALAAPALADPISSSSGGSNCGLLVMVLGFAVIAAMGGFGWGGIAMSSKNPSDRGTGTGRVLHEF